VEIIGSLAGFWVATPVVQSQPDVSEEYLDLLIHGIKVSQTRKQLSLLPASTGLLLGLLFRPENGGDMLLRNVGIFPNYMTYNSERRNFQLRNTTANKE
jgi:hypothetical protein